MVEIENFSLEEKITLSEIIIDDFLLTEQGWANTAISAVQTVQGLGSDAARLSSWWKEKREKKKAEQMMRMKSQEEKQKRKLILKQNMERQKLKQKMLAKRGIKQDASKA